jgi:hypothetical protein
MKEVYYVMGHGIVQTEEVLDHRQRFNIPIISIGTEGNLTYPCPTMLLIPYYMKIYGNVFMNKLFTILLEYGPTYAAKFRPNKTKLEQDIRFLFDINQKEQTIWPQNVLRAYSGSAKVLNTSITSFRTPAETFFYDAQLSHNKQQFTILREGMASAPNSQYLFNEITFPNQDQMFSLVNPFGIFKFDEQKRTFDMKYRMTEAIHPVSLILKEINRQSTSTPIVFMIHCKEPDKQLLKFNFRKDPLEKFHTKSLTQMMKSLNIKNTPPTRKTKKRKTLKQTNITIKKRTGTTPPTKRTKLTEPIPGQVQMDISPPKSLAKKRKIPKTNTTGTTPPTKRAKVI